MPILPPARRNWKAEEVVTLSVGQVSVKWPPKGFKSMIKDLKKLIEAEYAAMMVREVEGKNNPLHRGELLYTFNFFYSARYCSTLATEGVPRRYLRAGFIYAKPL